MMSVFEHATALASQRPASEDRADVIALGDSLVIVVADGAGGMRGGAMASDALVTAVQTRAAKPAFDPYDLRAWVDVLRTTDTELATARSGETTAIVVVVGPHAILGVSVGDSEAWMMSPRRIDRLTENQSRQRLGSGRANPIAFHRRGLEEGVLIASTDGLFKHARADRIAAAVTPPFEGTATTIAERLVALPRLPSGDYADDVAVVVVRAMSP
jgi:serine/threonine protein phosphatase PrpC